MAVYKNENGELFDYTKGNTLKPDAELSPTSENSVQNKVVYKEINELKKSVSDGKTLVATAITDKGVETAADATFAVMADNISQIETGGGELHGATISVTTTESTLIGKTIKLSLNSTTVATKTFDSNGACSFTDIQEAGTYSLYSTDGTDSATIPVDITAENVVNKTVISCEFYLTPDGETITPVDDVAILLKCAEIKDKSYTTMDELLADEQAMGDITMSENAMKYLARSTGFADAVCANETFMTLLGQSAYVDATVLNSDIWISAICGSVYMNKILQSLIPTMTSNTSPSGESYSSALWDTGYAWRAFDGSTKGAEMSQNDGAWYVVYDFKKEVEMNLAQLYSPGNDISLGYTLYIDVFYDNDWHQISSNTITTEDWRNCSYTSKKPWNCAFNKVNGLKIRFRTTEPNYGYNNLTIFTEIKVYGRTII